MLSSFFRSQGCLRVTKPRFAHREISINSLSNYTSDEHALAKHFDEFKNPNIASDGPRFSTGLFHHPLLRHHSQFKDAASLTLFRANKLVDRICNAPSSPSELRKVVKNLDRLSDTLCGIVDLAELVRNAHPDPEWVTSANEAYEMLCEFIAVLNTHTGLSGVRNCSLFTLIGLVALSFLIFFIIRL